MPPTDMTTKPNSNNRTAPNADPDKHDAWVLRAGAELWKAVVAEADHPAHDTHAALQAVRAALNAARRLRFAGDIPSSERHALVRLAALAEEAQTQALRRWGQGRGLDWGEDWGEHWGESLAEEAPPEKAPADHSADAGPDPASPLHSSGQQSVNL